MTVAGRNGAGRLGKESEKLLMPVIGTYYMHIYMFIFLLCKSVIVLQIMLDNYTIDVKNSSIFIQWKVHNRVTELS